MSNYVNNILEVRGEPHEIKMFFSFIRSIDSAFDFQQITPIPSIFSQKDYYKYTSGLQSLIQHTEYNALVLKSTGSVDFQSWIEANWGCPGSSVNCKMINSYSIAFDTRSAIPTEIFKKLSGLFKRLKFRFYFRAGDGGRQVGVGFVFNGEISGLYRPVKESAESFGMGQFIHDCDIEGKKVQDMVRVGEEIIKDRNSDTVEP